MSRVKWAASPRQRHAPIIGPGVAPRADRRPPKGRPHGPNLHRRADRSRRARLRGGYAAAAALSQHLSGNAQIIQARAADYAESRLVCGAHYRRDIEAGHVLGVALLSALMTKPAFRAELEAARAELTAAHLTP